MFQWVEGQESMEGQCGEAAAAVRSVRRPEISSV